MSPHPHNEEKLREEFNNLFVETNGWKLRRPEENAQIIFKWCLSKIASTKEEVERKWRENLVEIKKDLEEYRCAEHRLLKNKIDDLLKD